MSAPTQLAHARLIELEVDFSAEKAGGKNIAVQFNPETLKLSYANQLVQPQGGDQAAGTSGRQFVGAGTTKLALSLWFDVTAMTDGALDDVRRLTTEVIHFMTPSPDRSDPKKMVPPATRFSWGNFLFDGIVESLEEQLEYFSQDGKPLRAQITLGLGQQKILVSSFSGDGRRAGPGATPLAPARAGESLQQMAGRSGGGVGISLSGSGAGIGAGIGWKDIATANGIEDPLRLAPGQLIDVRAQAPAPNVTLRPPRIQGGR